MTFLPIYMFLVLAIFLFIGYPVAFILGGIAIIFGLIGILFDVFAPIQFFNLMPRIWGTAAANSILVAVPMFIFMGTILEKSGIADNLLNCLKILLRRVPGGLAISITVMGTIMAATTGIVGASVVMLTMIALPALLKSSYDNKLAVGTIASAGTLGILIPPSIMLVIMGDLLSVSVGSLFAGAVIPGLILASLYAIYIILTSYFYPEKAPVDQNLPSLTFSQTLRLIIKSFIPPVALIFLVLGSIFGGFATPTEASGIGCLGAMVLAYFNKKFNYKILIEIVHRAGMTNAMVFFIIFGATLFSYVFRSLGGDEIIIELLNALGINTPWEIVGFMLITTFILGFFFDWIEITLIVLPIFAPVLQTIDFSTHLDSGSSLVFLTWFVIMISVNLQTSFLTPPFGFTLFYMKGTVPKTISMTDIYKGIIPFVLIQLSTLILIVIFPDIVLWLPRQAGFLI